MTRMLPAILSLLLATPAATEEIDFDEIPSANDNCCYLSEEYADLGIHFETTDDGSIWDGLSAGDPGRWRLDGTRGQAFLGFNGRSYELTAWFDAPVLGFTLDAARASGSSGAAELRVWGLREGEIVERLVLPLGAVDHWVTGTLTSEIDAVRWKVLGDSGFRPYGVDHLRWEPAAPPEPDPIPVEIEVVPFGKSERIPLSRRGVLPVMLYGSDDFAVEDVDLQSLVLEPGAAPALQHWWGPHILDADRDGLFDALAFFRMRAAGLQAGHEWICLTGQTLDGDPFEGCEEVELFEPGERRAGPVSAAE